jgi:hypothetical protein
MKYNVFKSARVHAAAIGVAGALALFSVAPLAQASALTSGQVSAIINLLQVFGADSATIANVQAALAGTPMPNPTPSTSTSTSTSTPTYNGPGNAASCMSLSGTLSVGSQGEDVTKLQQFLAQNSSIYPQGLITGYYGSDTQEAVQRWQAAHGIVATGTPSTTGFGSVGPSTRGEMEREMETECNSGDSNNGSSDHAASSTVSHEGEGSSVTASSTASSTSQDN